MDQHEWIQTLHTASERPIYIGSKDQGPQEKPEENWKAIINNNTYKIASIVNKKYQIIQHQDVARSITEAINNLNIEAEYKVRSRNNRLILDIEFPKAKLYVNKEEEFIAGFRVINSYDKSTGIIILPRLVRMVCTNGMLMKSENFIASYRHRHNYNMTQKFSEYIQKALAETINAVPKLKEMVNDCIGDSTEWAITDKIIKKLFSIDKHRLEIEKLLKHIDHVTRWDLYNAITSYATHGRMLTPSVEMWLQSKAELVLNNRLEALAYIL